MTRKRITSEQILAAFRLIQPDLDFSGWEGCCGRDIGRQLNRFIAAIRREGA